MRLIALPEDQFTLAELVGPREPGVHLSDILQILKAEREPDKYRNDEGEWVPRGAELLRLEVGHTFEQLLRRALMERHPELVRPAPVTRDGIICSPDGWIPPARRLEEWKATWASTKRPLLDFRWYWFIQIMAYAYVLDAQEAVLRVFYVNGDYSRGDDGGPQVRAYRLSWYPGELEENWDMLVATGRKHGLLVHPRLTRRRKGG